WRAGGYVGPSRRRPPFHSPKPGREWSDCRRDGRVSGHLSSRSDSRSSISLCVCAGHLHPGRTLDRLLVPHPALQCRRCGTSADWGSGVPGAHRRLHLRGSDGAFVRRSPPTRVAKERGVIFEGRCWKSTCGETKEMEEPGRCGTLSAWLDNSQRVGRSDH